MTNKDEFFEEFVDAEEWLSDEGDDQQELWPGLDEEIDMDVRTVLMQKSNMLALLGLKTFAQGGIIVRFDPREERPAAQAYDDPSAATKWFNRSLATSRKNGWNVVYDGAPAYG